MTSRKSARPDQTRSVESVASDDLENPSCPPHPRQKQRERNRTHSPPAAADARREGTLQKSLSSYITTLIFELLTGGMVMSLPSSSPSPLIPSLCRVGDRKCLRDS